MKNKIFYLLFLVIANISIPVHASNINIRPGASDEEANFWIQGLAEGIVTPDDAQAIIDAGGFSSDIADRRRSN